LDTKLKNCSESIDASVVSEIKTEHKERFFGPFAAWFSLIVGLTTFVMLFFLILIHVDGSDIRNAFCQSPYQTTVYGWRIRDLMDNAKNQFDLYNSLALNKEHNEEHPLIVDDCILDDSSLHGTAKVFYYNPLNSFAYCNDTLSERYLRPGTAELILESYLQESAKEPGDSIIIAYLGKYDFRYYMNGTEYILSSDSPKFANVVNEYIGTTSNFYSNTFSNEKDGVFIYYLPVDSSSAIRSVRINWEQSRMIVTALLSCLIVSVLLIIIGFFMRKSRKRFVSRILAITGWFYSEIKLIMGFIALVCLISVVDEIGWIDFFPDGILASLFISICFWLVWYLLMDLIVHRKTYLRHSLIYTVFRQLWLFTCMLTKGKPFKKQMIGKLIVFLALECFLGFFIAVFMFSRSGLGLLFSIFLAFLGIALAVVYVVLFERALRDYSTIIDQISAMHVGTTAEIAPLSENSPVYQTSIQLGDLHSGMKRTMENMLRSERMKIELITNVSHDLKTPLTSIISYTDLLQGMKLVPEEANDYVTIVSQKAHRLHRMTNDLFDISKVETGNLPLHFARIDMSDHLRQTLAEMDEAIGISGLDFKVQIPGEPIYIRADGEKLYRIFENLIGNALKYSMEHTRVYLSIQNTGSDAVFTIKNIASYEMTFDADEITARFTRGDASRTEEGSGLGLAICRSFTQSFGGMFKVELDGDLFKATVTFPLYFELE